MKPLTARDWHPADLIAALKKRQLSLKQLSRDNGYSPDVLKVALRRPYPKAERIIATALQLAPETIWPSRYNANGISNRLRKQPAAHSTRANANAIADPAGANANVAGVDSKGASYAALQEFTLGTAKLSAVFEDNAPAYATDWVQIRGRFAALQAGHKALALASRDDPSGIQQRLLALDELLGQLEAHLARLLRG